MDCPTCQTPLPQNAQFCWQCGQKIESRLWPSEVQLSGTRPRQDSIIQTGGGSYVAGKVDVAGDFVGRDKIIGIQAGVVQGNVYGGDTYQVQIYALTNAGRNGSWKNFLQENTPPYKFLASYSAKDHELFKGREQDTEEVLRRIGQQRLLVLYGSEGVGKTSLLEAGVIPALLAQGAMAVQLREYEKPLEALRSALESSAKELPIALPPGGSLLDVVTAIVTTVQGSLVLVLDQLERLFESPTKHEVVDFLRQALSNIEPGYLRIVLSLRDEALEHLLSLQAVLPSVLESPYKLGLLDQAQAVKAVVEPLAVLNFPVHFAPEVVSERLVPDLDELSSEREGIHPVHLQIVCYWLYQKLRGRQPSHLDEQLYDEVRGVNGIMAIYLEETLHTRFAGERHLVATWALDTLAGPASWMPSQSLRPEGVLESVSSEVLNELVQLGFLVRRSHEGQLEYSFTTQTFKEEVRRSFGKPGLEVEDELERVWAQWLARAALAETSQLEYLAIKGKLLKPQATKALLLLRSAVAQDSDPEPWLNWLKAAAGQDLLRQLEEPGAEVNTRSSISNLNEAKRLLGLATRLASQQRKARQTPDKISFTSFASVTEAATHSPDAVSRRTATLALTVPFPDLQDLIYRLEKSLQTNVRAWQRRGRVAELRGTLAEFDPHVAALNVRLPLLERVWIWGWRVRHRLRRERQSVFWLPLGSAVGAGLGLGLFRALIGLPNLPIPRLGIFGLYFYFGCFLGAFSFLGFVLAQLLPLEGALQKLRVVVSILLTAVGATAALSLVAALNGLRLEQPNILFGCGFAGLGLGLALSRQGLKGQLDRNTVFLESGVLGAGLAALFFVVAQLLVIVRGPEATSLPFPCQRDIIQNVLASDSALPVVLSGSTYRALLASYCQAWWQEPLTAYPRALNWLSLGDAAFVALWLTLGITTGLRLAQRELARRHLLE
jgi:hypothetical protein